MAKKNEGSDEPFGDIKKNLEKLARDMLDIAKNVVEDYDVDPATISGSINEIVQVHENSPFLKDIFNSNEWKKVLDPNLPEKPEIIEEDKKDDSK